jgi:hypothetical protein
VKRFVAVILFLGYTLILVRLGAFIGRGEKPGLPTDPRDWIVLGAWLAPIAIGLVRLFRARPWKARQPIVRRKQPSDV